MGSRIANPSVQISIVIGLVVVAVYHAVGTTIFIGDDIVRIACYDGATFLAAVQTCMGNRPILSLILWAVGRVAGRDPQLFKWTALLLHAAMAIAYLYLLLDVLGRAGKAPVSKAMTWTTGLVALAFAVHPLNSQVVLSVVQMGVQLSALGLVLALLAVGRYADTGKREWFGIAVLCFLAGVFSKPGIVTAAPVIGAYYWLCLGGKGRDWRKGVLLSLPFLAVGSLPVIIQFAPNAFRQPVSHSAFGYFLQQIEVTAMYLWKIVFPTSLRFMYPVRFGEGPASPDFWLAVAGHAFLITVAIEKLRRGQLYFSWAIFSAYAMFLPESGFFPITHVAFEHRVYIPMTFLLLAVVLQLQSLSIRPRRAATAVCAIAVVFFCWRTHLRVNETKDYIHWAKSEILRNPGDVYGSIVDDYAVSSTLINLAFQGDRRMASQAVDEFVARYPGKAGWQIMRVIIALQAGDQKESLEILDEMYKELTADRPIPIEIRIVAIDFLLARYHQYLQGLAYDRQVMRLIAPQIFVLTSLMQKSADFEQGGPGEMVRSVSHQYLLSLRHLRDQAPVSGTGALIEQYSARVQLLTEWNEGTRSELEALAHKIVATSPAAASDIERINGKLRVMDKEKALLQALPTAGPSR